jgi:hypothetical protein
MRCCRCRAFKLQDILANEDARVTMSRGLGLSSAFEQGGADARANRGRCIQGCAEACAQDASSRLSSSFLFHLSR